MWSRKRVPLWNGSREYSEENEENVLLVGDPTLNGDAMSLSARRVQLMITYPHLKRFLKKAPPIEEVRRILRGIDGELSDDILKERDEEWR